MSIDVLMIIYILIVSTYYILINSIGIAINFFCKRFDVKRNYDYQPTVSVVMSCFNEGEAVYQTIKSMRASNYPVEKLEILAFDDCSKDDSFSWIEKAAQDFANVVARKSPRNQGKAHNFLDAVEISTGEIIVGVDSDCLFDANAIQNLMSCFTEERIAAVGGRVGVQNANVNWLTRFQTFTYALSFLVIKSPERIFRKIQCLSGPLVAIRRERFNEIKDQIATRNFFGIRITNGEDRALTQMLLLKGYNTYLNLDALCFTNVPTTISQYAKQQLRWRRSAVGQYFQLVISIPQMLLNNGFISAFFSFFPVFVLLAWNSLVITAWMSGKFIPTMMGIVLCHFVIGPCIVTLFYYYARHSRYSDLMKISLFDLLLCRIYAAFWYPISTVIITLFALFTLDDGGWVTRETGATS
ncbi:MAG: glycosyltransferase [Legionella sp.]|jgi:hyaluronan synthase